MGGPFSLPIVLRGGPYYSKVVASLVFVGPYYSNAPHDSYFPRAYIIGESANESCLTPITEEDKDVPAE